MYARLRAAGQAQYAELRLRRINAHSDQALRRRLPKPRPKIGSQAMPLREEVTAACGTSRRFRDPAANEVAFRAKPTLSHATEPDL
jgi:hypothetical protein